MRRHHVDALGDRKPGRVGIDHEGARCRGVPPAPRRCGRTRSRSRRCRRWRSRSSRRRARIVAVRGAPRIASAATSEPASGSDSANAAIASPARRAADSARCCSSVPARVIAPRAQALHGEGEIGEAVVARQRLADAGRRARVDQVGRAAVGGAADRIARPAGRAQLAHQRAAGGVDVGSSCMARDVGSAPRRRARARASRCASSKNGQSR